MKMLPQVLFWLGVDEAKAGRVSIRPRAIDKCVLPIPTLPIRPRLDLAEKLRLGPQSRRSVSQFVFGNVLSSFLHFYGTNLRLPRGVFCACKLGEVSRERFVDDPGR